MVEARVHFRVRNVAGAFGLVVLSMSGLHAAAEPSWPTAEQPAYPNSPYHGVLDGNGKLIPCQCRFQGQAYRLGDVVCMSTHLGVVLTRCDLLQNNTSWVPTGTACTISRAGRVTQVGGG